MRYVTTLPVVASRRTKNYSTRARARRALTLFCKYLAYYRCYLDENLSHHNLLVIRMALTGPSLAELRFLPDAGAPFELWRKCVKAKNEWEQKLSSEEKEAERMKKYQKKMTVELIWLTNTLEDTLPEGVSKKKADEVLTQAYDMVDDLLYPIDDPGLCQLIQHLKAFKYLCQKPESSDALPELSEDLIKKTHEVMMRGLKNEQGMVVNAGYYRVCSVFAGNHTFPAHTCIPASMERIVKEYNDKFSKPHDLYELASWLHLKVVSLHPFEDGNGRISRLLWCYSLMRDGLPFPTVLTSGHKRSQKHLVLCLKRDRDLFVTNNPHLTTLTVVSVNQAWEDYFTKFR